MPLRGLLYAVLIWMGTALILGVLVGTYLHWRNHPMGTHCDACGQPSTKYVRLTKVGRDTLCPDCRLDAEGEARESQGQR